MSNERISLFSKVKSYKPKPPEERTKWKSVVGDMNLSQLRCAFMYLLDGYDLERALQLGRSLAD